MSNPTRPHANGSDSAPIAAVRDVEVGYPNHIDVQPAVRSVSIEIRQGEIYGLVGESGSGKTTLGYVVMGYLPPGAELRSGSVEFAGHNLFQIDPADRRRIWREQIAYVPQDSLTALNPSVRILNQMREALPNSTIQSQDPTEVVTEWLRKVRIPNPEETAYRYPHELSGGMQQRVLLAMAFSIEPKLLILDEPTTNLDTLTQMAILSLVRELVQSQETTALYITHNLSVLRTLADRIGVMYAGELLEQGDAEAVFDHPIHPYTQGLIRSDPAFVRQDRDLRLYSIPGSRPSEKDLLTGCTFRDRCPLRVDECEQHPELVDADREQKVRCIRWQEIRDGTIQLGVSTEAHRVRPFGEREMLEILDVDVHYPGPRTLRQILANQPAGSIPALDNVNASIREGNTLGLVGESGSGKTSLANAILGLVERSSGEIRLEGETLPKGLEGRDQGLRRKLGVVFQHPIDSFNPRVTLGHSLRRSAQKLLGYSKAESERLVRELVEAVQIPLDYLDRYPDQVSGGEAQRLAIARAFSTRPDVLIADEAVSALDVSIQATILNLLEDLQDDYGSAMLFISHDLAVVEYMADAIAVLLTGVVMEIVPTEKIHVPPIHPYTEALRAALPGADQASISVPDFEDGSSTVYGGQTSGCPYHSRCHRYLGDLCAQQFPPWQDLGEGMGYRCHIAPADLISERRIQMDPEEV